MHRNRRRELKAEMCDPEGLKFGTPTVACLQGGDEVDFWALGAGLFPMHSHTQQAQCIISYLFAWVGRQVFNVLSLCFFVSLSLALSLV